MLKPIRALLIAPIFIFSQAAVAGIVYTNDFEGGSTANLSGITAIEDSPSGESFLGFFNFNASSTLSLSGLATHTDVTLDFDVYGIRSLDSTTSGDSFSLGMNGGSKLFTDYYGHSGGKILGPTTGTAVNHDSTALGYGSFYGGASTYHYTFTFADSASAIDFNFLFSTQSGWDDEAFGLDNVVVSTNANANASVPEPSVLALIGIGFAGLLGFGSLRRKTS
jgi:hypothetical protein